jgi:hypothetical protein
MTPLLVGTLRAIQSVLPVVSTHMSIRVEIRYGLRTPSVSARPISGSALTTEISSGGFITATSKKVILTSPPRKTWRMLMPNICQLVHRLAASVPTINPSPAPSRSQSPTPRMTMVRTLLKASVRSSFCIGSSAKGRGCFLLSI